MKNVVKNDVKLFTKEEKDNIIEKKYNLLKENLNNFRKRGIYMKKQRNIILNKVEKELNWKERIIFRLFTKTFIKMFNASRNNIVNDILND